MAFMLFVGRGKVEVDICQLTRWIGGIFKDYKSKEHLPHDDTAIEIHFEGKATHGIYPLLEDNTSFFIAVDFDKTNWIDSIRKLHEIISYIE
jgi:hypothetical protein